MPPFLCLPPYELTNQFEGFALPGAQMAVNIHLLVIMPRVAN